MSPSYGAPRDTALAIEHMAAKRVGTGLGHIVDMASSGRDLYVLSRQNADTKNGTAQADQNSYITLLRDQDQDGQYEVRSLYLVGFSGATSLDISRERLYIADQNGLWHGKIDGGLIAQNAPALLHSLSGISDILASRDGSSLYILAGTTLPIPDSFDKNVKLVKPSFSTTVYAMDTRTALAPMGRLPVLASGNLASTTLAQTPTGDLWIVIDHATMPTVLPLTRSAYGQNLDALLTDHVRGKSTVSAPSPLGVTIQGAIDLPIFALTKTTSKNTQSHTTAIVFHHDRAYLVSHYETPFSRSAIQVFDFNYGALMPSTRSVSIEGNTNTTASFLDRNLQITSLLSVGENQLLLADAVQGEIWRLVAFTPKPVQATASPAPPTEPALAAKTLPTKRPKLLQGSSIISGSNIVVGSAIGKHEALQSDRFSYKKTLGPKDNPLTVNQTDTNPKPSSE